MAYRKLSELISEVSNIQQSDTFVKLFKAAVRDGKIEAMDLSERFTMPKVYKRRDEEGTYQRSARNMMFAVTPKMEKWFAETNELLVRTGNRSLKVKPTVEAIESGAFDFTAAAQETRRKMQAKFVKGQQLGQSRSRKKK